MLAQPRYGALAGIITGATTILTFFALGSPTPVNAAVAVTIGFTPYTYLMLRQVDMFQYERFYRDKGPVRVAGWILLAMVATGLPAVVLGAAIGVFVQDGLVGALLGIPTGAIPYLAAWPLVVRYNQDYRNETENDDEAA